MFHLFNSAVRVEELSLVTSNGRPSMQWVQATSDDPIENGLLQFLPCRLDLNFLREGKDILPAPVAGKAPDRVGVMFTYPYAPIKAGQQVVAIPNAMNELPIEGTFQIRAIPDKAIGFSTAHHIEVQIVESGQNLTGKWPWEDET